MCRYIVKMVDISSKSNGPLTGLDALASGLGYGPAFEEGADELRGMVGNSGLGNSGLALALKSAWSNLYGADTSLWPENLRTALATIEAGAGLTNFSDNLTPALQGLQLEEAAMPAFEAAANILRFWISRLQPAPALTHFIAPSARGGQVKGAAPVFSIITDSAARAWLSFISNPLALVVPVWAGGMAGRTAAGLTANAGKLLALADDAAAGIAVLFGLTGEAAGFVGASRVISAGVSAAPAGKYWRGDLVYSLIEETFASTLFFGGLRACGAAGRFIAGILPHGETGLALAKFTGHAASVLGLAVTEDVQEKMGGVLAANKTGHPREGDVIWRALFLHATLRTVNSVVSVNAPHSRSHDIIRTARALQDMAQPPLDPLVFAQATARNTSLDSSAGGGPARGITPLFAAKKTGSGDRIERERRPPLASKEGKLIYVTPSGLKINHETIPYGQLLKARLRTLRYHTSDKTAQPKDIDIYKAFLKVEEAGSYRDLLIFFIAFDHGDRTSAETFKGFEDWPAETLIGTAREEFERMFPEAPELPARHGIWTEFVETFKALREGRMRPDQFVNALQGFASAMRTEITISAGAIHFGPVTITKQELFDIFKGSVQYHFEVKSKRRPTHRKELQKWLAETSANKHAVEWLARTDVPEDAKQKVCMLNLLDPFDILEPEREPGGHIIFRMFVTGEIVKMSAAEQVRVIDDLYKRHVEQRHDPAKEDNAAAALPSSFSDWKAIKLPDLFNDDTALPSPNRSYTLFRSFTAVAEKVTRAIRRAYRNEPGAMRAETRLAEDMGFLASFILNGAAEEQVRGMVLDIVYHYNTKEPLVAERLRETIERYPNAPALLRQEIFKIYKEHFPFADALFARLAEETAARESPKAVAEGIWLKFQLGQDEFSGGRTVLQHMPAQLRPKLKAVLTKAMIAVQFDRDTYLPWMRALERLGGSPEDWAWLDDQKDAVEALQELAYPVGMRSEIVRPGPGSQALGFRPDGTSWQRFKALTAFLTPSEWNTLMAALEDASSNIREVARALETRFPDRPLPSQIYSRKQLLRARSFAETVAALGSILEKSLGEANARLCRRLLRAIASDPEAVISLLEFGHKLHLTQTAGKFSLSQAMETMAVIRDIMDTPFVSGDFVGLAMRHAFYRTQSVQAELAQVKDLVARGFAVQLIPPAAELFQKSPDIEAVVTNNPDARPILIEVKSREWARGEAKFDVIREAVEEGRVQVDDRIKREYASHGFIALYLTGNTTAEDVSVLQRLDALMLKDNMGGIKGIFVYFVDKSGREWKIGPRHEIYAPRFRNK